MKKIEKKENKKSFFARLKKRFNNQEISDIHFAYTLAKRLHKKQKRDNGERYFEHLRRCVLILVDELKIYDVDFIIILLLHDAIEDCPWFMSWFIRLSIRYYFGKKIANSVKALSKPKVWLFLGLKKLRNWYYFRHVKKSHLIIKLFKLIDRLDNMRTIWGCSPAKQWRKIKETEKYFFDYLEDVRKKYPKEAAYLEKELLAALARAKKSLKREEKVKKQKTTKEPRPHSWHNGFQSVISLLISLILSPSLLFSAKKQLKEEAENKECYPYSDF